MKLNLIDKTIAYFSPSAGVERAKKRSQLDYYNGGYGNPDQGYITNISSKPTMRGWGATANDVNFDIIPKLDAIRASSRDLAMNAPLVSATLDRFQQNTIGNGLILKPIINYKYLKLTEEDAKTWEQNISDRFYAWAKSIFSDVELTNNFHENAALCFYNLLLSGDVFILLLPNRYQNNTGFNICLKVVEADHCTSQFSIDTSIIAGVEIDSYGAPIAYHFRALDNNFYNYQTKRIPRFNSLNQQQVLHMFLKKRPGQKRGVSIFAPVIESLKQLTRYKGAELDAAVVNAMFTVFIKNTNNGGLQSGYSPLGMMGAGDNAATTGNLPGDENVYELGKANIIELPQNQDISLADPRHPNSGFPAFYQACVEELGATVGVSPEMVMMKFSSSFSAAKAAIQEAWKTFKFYRTFCENKYYNPIYESWLTSEILTGNIVADGFFDNLTTREAWLGKSWIGSKQGMIDPLRETQASVLRVDNRLSTREQEYTREGDWDDAMRDFKKLDDLLTELNIQPKAQMDTEILKNQDTTNDIVNN